MYYDLDERPLDGPIEWAEERRRAIETGLLWVAQDPLPEGGQLSTVWLGLDHGLFEDEPLIYESMYFAAGGYCEVLDRYPTREAAARGHAFHLIAMFERLVPHENPPRSTT
jgi:hypothetical protein